MFASIHGFKRRKKSIKMELDLPMDGMEKESSKREGLWGNEKRAKAKATNYRPEN
jgi:hypothetical protein